MGKIFGMKQMAQIAAKVVQYKKLYVTTSGQMFMTEPDAEEAARTKNLILVDANEHIGVTTLTEDMFTNEKNREYAKNPEKFSELFKDAKIPVDRKKETFQRKREKVATDDVNVVANVNAAFGLGGEVETKPVEQTNDEESVPDKKAGGLFGGKK